jgi:transposase
VGLCQQDLKQDPYSGRVYVFRNKTKNAVKILIYDGTGFWLCLKRFSQGRLKWWPTSPDAVQSITPTALQILLSQGNPSDLRLANDWRSITPVQC